MVKANLGPSRQRNGWSKMANEGFTVIEVMIVLAIAGMIFFMVFQAIPALSRSGRNNDRKQDVAAILQAVSQYELNQSGDFPPPITPSNDFLVGVKDKLRYYEASNVIANVPPAAGAAVNHLGSTSAETVNLYNYQKCDPNTTGASTKTGAGYTDVVALFAIEGSGGAVKAQCQQL